MDSEHPRFQQFTRRDLEAARAELGERYLEFLRVPTMNAGLYQLPAGADDQQEPHDEDELYYVLAGRCRFTAGGESCDAEAGSVLFVRAGVDHRFHDIEEDLTVLVVFASAASG